jgi:hypothetical protein
MKICDELQPDPACVSVKEKTMQAVKTTPHIN